MNTNVTTVNLKDATANPGPLGLLAFGMTTVLLNFHNAGFYELNTMIMAMGIFYGGLAQVIAGIMEWKKGNTFGTAAFTSYGFFWLTLVGIWVFPGLGLGKAPNDAAMTAYLLMWGIFTTGMFFATLKGNFTLKFVFASLAILFYLLALEHITGSEAIGTIAGFEGIICGASAVYTGLAEIINEHHKKSVLPL